MMRKLRLCAGVMALGVLMLASASCGSDPNLLFITVIPSTATLSCGAPTLQFIANGVFERGPDQDITNSVTWASAQPQIATISSGGLATLGVQTGATIITASLQGKTDTASVNSFTAPCGP